MEKVKTVIGIISFNDKHYLEKMLPTIVDFENTHIVILDNAGNDEIKKFIEKEYPQIDFIRHKDGNTGFGKGHNYIVEMSPASDYYFCVNNDILIEKEGFEACVKHLDEDEETCVVAAKLHHWDFENDKKTDIIDTLGVVGSKAHHFWDRGQGKKDKGQYDATINDVFGVSGAAFFIRRSCIFKLHGSQHTIFDENIFMYKEDVDLAYRMRWQGMKISFLKNVLGYHARTLGKGKKKSLFEATMSYKNHRILLRNNFSKKYSLKTKVSVFVYEMAKFLYYRLTKPEVAGEYFKVRKMKNLEKPEMKITPKEMESYFLT
ncbi:glycosyltransferase [Patescibacteria group bacterium]